ncbi:AT-hook motif nuclear-localized protein 13-like [Trifolium pratense]|uniref:AT-hook motif nuclear-localized protein 13-like n=1 Tax=Trifolium pratense TaxID=57577 RepID=UPI001E6902D9|nr:AT-hook motif nuclear-localized protein 13-like [Trifolium pratense]XP_045810818.1 AT-hook motif nuclear-localized protein 13-like [Trifolium pratense]
MESREANNEHETQQQPRPPPLQHQFPRNLQTATMVLVGPNLFTNSTVPTTMMTPVTAQFPPFNMNIHPSPRENFNNNINDIVTVPQTAPSTTLMPCMTVAGGSSSVFPSASDSSSAKRKRGRPRKYFGDGEVDSGSGSGQAQAAVVAPPPATATAVTSPDSSAKSARGRGRPRGSFKQKNVIGLAGTCFTPYVIIVNPGEDIVAKLTAACRGGPNSEICIFSAHGLVSTVALHHLEKIATYEGTFEIVSLSGTLASENNNGGKRMGSWKVSLCGGRDARIWGGVVANKLIAASSVKVILGSFTVDGKKASSSNWNSGPSSAPSSQFAAFGTPTGAMSQGHSCDESSGDNDDNPFIHGPSGVYNNAEQPIPNLAGYQQMWARHTQQ